MAQLDGRDEHRDMNSKYVLWVLDDGSNVVFLHKNLLNNILYGDRRFVDWLMVKPAYECCRMVSRTLLASLRYKPDYIVLVGDDDESGAPYASGHSMSTILKMAEGCPTLYNIKRLAECGGGGIDSANVDQTGRPDASVESNFLGHRLSELCCTLADRGFFSDARNRVKYGKTLPHYA